jgi:protein-disulfide isomerase
VRRQLNWSRMTNAIANIAILGVAAWVIARPGGVIGGVVRPYLARRAQVKAITAVWNRLLAEAPAIQVGTNARLALVEFGDYECPAGVQQHRLLPGILRNHPDMGWRYIQFPLAVHRHADLAARAALCADEQGKFREMHNRLFASSPDWSTPVDWVGYASEVGVADHRAFESCMHADRTTERLAKGVTLARDLGIGGTPSFVYMGGVHRGVLSDSALVRLLSMHH